MRAAIAAATLTVAFGVLLVPLKLCVFAMLFHVPCPGCGMTRALWCMLRGDLRGAIAYNPLAPLILPWIAVVAARHAFAYVRSGDAWRLPPSGRAEHLAAAALIVLLVALWSARFWGYFGGPVPV